MKSILKYVLTIYVFFIYLTAVNAQNSPTVITSFNFRNLNSSMDYPHMNDGSWSVPNVFAEATSTYGWEIQTGTQTGNGAFGFELGGDGNPCSDCDALRFNMKNPINNHNLDFRLFGSEISNYSSYRMYFQARNENGNFNRDMIVLYSLDGISYSQAATFNIGSLGTSYFEYEVDLSSITSLNNQPELFFRIRFESNSGNQNRRVRIDNVQFSAINTMIGCSSEAQLISYMVNGCSSGCEGADEYLIIQTGSSSYDLDQLTVAWPDTQYEITQGYCHTGCGTWHAETNNYFTQLSADRYNKYNTEAGCGNLIIAPPSDGIIPPNSTIFVFAGCPGETGCADYDFSAFCNGPIYGIAMGDLTCNDGRFSNTDQRQWSSVIGDPRCGVYTHVYQMRNPCGSYPCTINGITYEDGDEQQGQAIVVTDLTEGYKISDACLSPVPLPVELVDFKATIVQTTVLLSWVTATETNNDFFTIEASEDGLVWLEKGTVNGAGTVNTEQTYTFEDRSPVKGISYYRLKQTDYDGVFAYSDIRSVFFLIDGEVIYRVNMLGQEVDENYRGIVILIMSNGERYKVIQ